MSKKCGRGVPPQSPERPERRPAGCLSYQKRPHRSLVLDVKKTALLLDSRFDPRQQPPRFQVCRDALGHEAGVLHRRKVRRGLAKGDEARRGARQVRREEVAVEGGPRPTWLGLGLG